MNIDPRLQQTPPAVDPSQLWENVFTPYRARILYPIAIVGALIFLPLAVVDFMRGRAEISAILLCIVVMLATDAVALYRGRQPPIPFAVLLVPGVAGVAMSLATQGVYGTLWAYPVVFLGYFVVRRGIANVVAAVMLAGVTLLTAMALDFGTAARFFLSLALCVVIINIMMNVLESLHARLLEQTITDPLTGAFNRRHMDENLGEAVERLRRSGAPASAVLVDVDHFKRVNDKYGHAVGDRVLKSVVRIVQDRRRKLDLLFRHGGEEFLLLLPDTRGPEATLVAEILRGTIERSPILGDSKVTVSIGVGELRRGESAADWMQRVDASLYRAKSEGRNRVAGDATLHAVQSATVRRISA